VPGLMPGGQDFSELYLAGHTEDNRISLNDWVENRAPEAASDSLILQMDIEGSEFEVLEAASDRTLRKFRIIVVELHGLRHLKRLPDFRLKVKNVLARLNRIFIRAHIHPNNASPEWVHPTTG
jgi:hypothetical protein